MHTADDDRYVLPFEEVDRTQVAVVGGKGAHLAELARIDGVRVPPGFCVTTHAFRRILTDAPSIDDPLARLARLRPDDADTIRALSGEVRRSIEAVAVPGDVAAAITGALARLGEQTPCAVRSSATAEDSPTASFAGQQDTFLNVVGADEILRHVRRCWASLFTERSVAYRLRNGIDPRGALMAVIVQRMVAADASGVLFTADPVTSNRKVVAVEAVLGLGEALVSGLADADSYTVRNGEIVTRTVATKEVAIGASPAGGTREQAVEPSRRKEPALTDEQVVRLARLGRRIEAHFGRPQDVEWCLVGDVVHIVQSRPITTLFPIPAVDDDANHVYVSVGHQQMMTDAMKPLGLAFWQMTTPRPMAEAGGRLFVDVTEILASPASRAGFLDMVGRSDPLIGDAVETVLARGDFVPTTPDEGPTWTPPSGALEPPEPDPAIVAELMARNQASIAALKREISAKSGEELLDFILADMVELRRLLFDPESRPVYMAAMEGTWWLNEQLHAWLGEKNPADTLTQSVPDSVTSEMGLALLDVADVVRAHPNVVEHLHHVVDHGVDHGVDHVVDHGVDHVVDDERFLEELALVEGGREAAGAIRGFLDRYGMRCVGEIDITRPRWSERPTTLVPLILGNVASFEPGEAQRRFEKGRREAQEKEQQLLERLRSLPDGERKADETKRTIDRVRTFIGYREYPKYGMISRYLVYKQALLAEAERLAQAGVLAERDDIFFLRFDELHEVVRTQKVDDQLIRRRKDEFRSFEPLSPPRVLTSDGEAVAGRYRRDGLPPGALVGLPVSAGIVEGRARVVLDMADAEVAPGDILVTAFTDPSWSPLFVAVEGLVTEVGGLMTHGAVVAREYGLPAVVGVEDATRLIADGQRIRVDGTHGYVEVLDG